MKIISLTICPFVERVMALLVAKNIDYETTFIDSSHKPEWFLAMSPHHQVPILITDDGDIIFESEAIVEYLEEAYPPLQPNISLIQKAKNRSWSYLAVKNYLVQCSAMRSFDKNTLQKHCDKLHQAFAKIENQLGDKKFFNTDDIGMVDIAWLPILHRADIIHHKTGYDFIKPYPKLRKWQKQLMKTELAKKSVAADFIKVFSNFYLSNETYLGRGDDTKKMASKKTCC
ncbi:MAG: glutathione S-transferase family protein [Alphaproteobacteria bacterium]